jgi:hypothetical protein
MLRVRPSLHFHFELTSFLVKNAIKNITIISVGNSNVKAANVEQDASGTVGRSH